MVAVRRSPHMNVMVEAVQKAGRALIRDFGEIENLQVSKKGPGDFVSAADLKSEKIIVATLQKARPSYGLLLEEGGEIKGEDKEFSWIVDPLDGTTNFLHGIPHWSVTIALKKGNEIVAGVIYDPTKDELYTAEKGGGSFMNNRRLRVAARRSMIDSLLVIGSEKSPTFQNDILSTAPFASGFRRFGSACLDLAYVAAGRFDAYWERGLKPWDAAAGSLLVKEAGGYVSDYEGGKDFVFGGSLIAANNDLHADLLKKLKTKTTKPKTAS